MKNLVNAKDTGLLYFVPHTTHRKLFFSLHILLWNSLVVEPIWCYKNGSIYASYSGKCNKTAAWSTRANWLYSNHQKNPSITSQESLSQERNFDLLPLTIILDLIQKLPAIIAEKWIYIISYFFHNAFTFFFPFSFFSHLKYLRYFSGSLGIDHVCILSILDLNARCLCICKIVCNISALVAEIMWIFLLLFRHFNFICQVRELTGCLTRSLLESLKFRTKMIRKTEVANKKFWDSISGTTIEAS